MLRDDLGKMNEDSLRMQILIPLFRAMGFKDVFHFHGGALELGKDIVMWKPGDFGERVNHAVVAKAEDITGQVTGKSGAGGVNFQIEQCFAAPYNDPATGEVQKVHRCYVVSSRRILKEAINAIRGILENKNLDKVTIFIDGDRLLWELIEQYQGAAAIWEHILKVQKTLSQVSPNHQLEVQIGKDRATFSIVPKHPKAEEQSPIEFKGTLAFPDTEEGKAASKELEDHIKSGSPLTMKAPFLKGFQFPEFLRPILDPEGKGIAEIQLGPVTSPKPVIARMTIQSQSDIEEIPYIHFDFVQIGCERATLENRNQPVPWRIELVVDRKEGSIRVNLSSHFDNSNVHLLLKTFRIQNMLAQGATVRLFNYETGLQVFESEIPTGAIEAPHRSYFDLVKKLVFIQEKTRFPLNHPNRELTIEEVREIFRAASILEKGRMDGIEGISVNLAKPGIQELIKQFETNEKVSARLRVPFTVKIFGKGIHQGYVSVDFEALSLTGEELSKLKEMALCETEFPDGIEVPFEPKPGTRMQVSFDRGEEQHYPGMP